MWLCTQHGFYSIVQKGPGEYHVRARLKRDLQNLQKLLAPLAEEHPELAAGLEKIHESRDADYRWRLVVAQPDVMMIMCALGDAIDYSNFKGRIHALPDQEEKSGAYSQLWAGLHVLQQ